MYHNASMPHIPSSDRELLKRAQSAIDKAKVALERSRDRVARTKAMLAKANRSLPGDQDG
jgi:hypothetical protein